MAQFYLRFLLTHSKKGFVYEIVVEINTTFASLEVVSVDAEYNLLTKDPLSPFFLSFNEHS